MSIIIRNFFKNPTWLPTELLSIEEFKDFPKDYITQVRDALMNSQSENPVVSIILTTYNEEANVVRCLDSISRNKSKYPFEVVMVNNNSTDETVKALEALGVAYQNQDIQGSGPARQMGLENSRGKYILLGDADCIYPERWIEEMVNQLKKKDTAVVYGRYSFISEKGGMPRWQLSLYEMFRDISMEIRHVKRPFLNAYGISMAFHKDQALMEGFIGDARRGNDGRLCFDLMKYGKVRRNRSFSSAAWTGTRTLMRDGSIFKAFSNRVMDNISRLGDFFHRMPEHDTKTSPTEDHSMEASIKRIKKRTGLSSF